MIILVLCAIFSLSSAHGINVTCVISVIASANTCTIRGALVLVDDEPVNILGEYVGKIDVRNVVITESRTFFIIAELFNRFGGLKELEIKDSGLRHVTPGVFKNATKLEYLIIGNNDLHTLEEGAFSGLNNLRYLKISKSNLKTLEAGAFGNLPKVELIILEKLMFPILPAGAFENLPALEEVRFIMLAFTEFTPGAFKNLTSLKTIAMQDMTFPTLPSQAFDAPKLTSFKLIGGTLEERELRIQQTTLTTINENAFLGLRSLENLQLYENRIDHLPGKVLHPLRSANLIDFDANSISRLDNDLFLQNGAHVATLSFQQNNISSIGLNFFDNLVNLNHLYMSGNNCTSQNFMRTNATFWGLLREGLKGCFANYIDEESSTTLAPITSTQAPSTTTRSIISTLLPPSSTARIDPENPQSERTFILKVRGEFVVLDENGRELLKA